MSLFNWKKLTVSSPLLALKEPPNPWASSPIGIIAYFNCKNMKLNVVWKDFSRWILTILVWFERSQWDEFDSGKNIQIEIILIRDLVPFSMLFSRNDVL